MSSLLEPHTKLSNNRRIINAPPRTANKITGPTASLRLMYIQPKSDWKASKKLLDDNLKPHVVLDLYTDSNPEKFQISAELTVIKFVPGGVSFSVRYGRRQINWINVHFGTQGSIVKPSKARP